MIEEREIWACAHLLMKQHGTNAEAFAQRRADEILARGETAGYRTFRLIGQRIRELEAVTPSGPPH